MRILILCLIIVCNFSFSQTLKGKVQNTLKEPISANILIKNSENKNLIESYQSDYFEFQRKQKWTQNQM